MKRKVIVETRKRKVIVETSICKMCKREMASEYHLELDIAQASSTNPGYCAACNRKRMLQKARRELQRKLVGGRIVKVGFYEYGSVEITVNFNDKRPDAVIRPHSNGTFSVDTYQPEKKGKKR